MFSFDSVYIPSSFENIYGLMQCTDDLSPNDCYNCLIYASGYLQQSGLNFSKQGVRVLLPSCNLRYESYKFFESNTAPALSPDSSPPANSSGKGNNSSTIDIIAVVLPITAVVLVSVLCICFFKRRKPKIKIDGLDDSNMVQSLQFDFDTIRAATANFSKLDKLGQSGFGPVYKGKLLNGEEVAVKRLSRDSGQGEEKLLIYEFLPNTILDHFIFDPIKLAQLNWEIHHKIIGGIVRGLLYLHEDSRLRIIHRDLKASNILLDKEMNPKISNFGTAKLFVVDQTQSTNRIVGTYGYMAPEYAMHGFFSIKSDVFSFGFLLLEIVSSRKNNTFFQLEHNKVLLSYAWRNWREGTAFELIDTTLRGNCSISEVMRCIHIGLLCVQENVADRSTMASIDLMFNSLSKALPIPSSPVFSVYNGEEADDLQEIELHSSTIN